MSRLTTVGFEAELDVSNSGRGLDADGWVSIMRDEGLWNLELVDEYGHDDHDDYCDDYCDEDHDHDYYGDPDWYPHNGPHENHCCCGACRWGASLLRVHYDSTCDGELVSDPLDWPSDRARALLVHLAGLFDEHGQQPGRQAGFHVHVSRQGRSAANVVAWFRHYEPGLDCFARMDADGNRGYNRWLSGARTDSRGWSKPKNPADPLTHTPGKGMALAVRPATFEFRLWNSVVTEWRMYLAIELSAAFCDAASAKPYSPTVAAGAPETVIEFVWDHLDDTARGYATRHLLGERGEL
jgi:hypothetical protein